MNYVEELFSGDTFVIKEDRFITTSDFKKNGSRLCINLADGTARWFLSSDIVNKISVYILDNDNNIISLKKEQTNGANIKIS